MRMQDSKDTRWNVDKEDGSDAKGDARDTADRPDDADVEATEAWRRYRKWVSSRRQHRPLDLHMEGLQNLERTGQTQLVR